ncbi:protein translocase subunit SecD [candidate division KSB1 bacterium]|nr:protein translocase subunit SecD [candidate division KSB1 bacterium]
MQRNNLFKTILIVVFLVLAIITLYPTFQVNPTQEKVDKLSQEISDLTGVTSAQVFSVFCGDIQLGSKKQDAELSKEEYQKNLENEMRTRSIRQLKLKDKEIIEKIVPLALDLRDTYTTQINYESKAIKMGLDLQGGTFLVSEVNIPKLVYNLAKEKDGLEPIFNEALAAYKNSDRDFIAILSEKLNEKNIQFRRFFGEQGDTDNEIREQLNKEAVDAVDRTLEVLRNRIDQFGVSEPNIQKQGDRRIIIELAGIKDINRAKNVIGTTAELRFQVVESERALEDLLNKINRTLRQAEDLDSTLNIIQAETDTSVAESDTTEKVADDEKIQLADLFKSKKDSVEQDTASKDTTSAIVDKNTYKEAPFTSLLRIFKGQGYEVIGVAPENRAAVEYILNLDKVKELTKDVEFLWGMDEETIAEQKWYRLYLVRKTVEMTGRYITNAKISMGGGDEASRAGEAEVDMTLNNEGAKIFSQLTERIINEKLAIILDGKVKSSPVVQVKIPNGRASIEGMASADEARDLALVLRAGALPAPMEFIEERTVGPSLGQDSVRKGTLAGLLGFATVVIFMVIYYNYFGIIADVALFLNLLLLMAALSGFGLTLTLPGVAGIILTLGMAVDANVLINERIREEEKTGKTIRAAIENGYGRAFITILDANVTTILTALVLLQFGTGPIKGFAITLFWGIAISMFTAIVVTRVIVDFMTARGMIKKLPF